MRIDCHTHFYPAGFLAAIERSSDHAVLRRERDGTLVLAYAGDYNVLAPAHHSLEARLADMERAGIDFAILSLTTPGVHVERTERGVALATLVNDEFATIQRQYPDRFRCLATLPLQAPERAARELERATRELGLVGAMLFSNVNGKPIDLPEFWPIYEAAEALGVPLVIHPTAPSFADVLADYRLVALLGFAYDTTMVAARMVLGGVLDRFPRLTLVQTHLGGALPYLAERIQRGYRAYPELQGRLRRDPLDYFRDMYFDTVLFDPACLLLGLAFAGEDRLILGSDHPHQVGDIERAPRVIEELPISPHAKNKILSENARRLFRLPIGMEQ
ncbi:amidohydrolase family protein [Thermomicrobium sp. 4228-Ro]|uniref:amidohydrolase family protein n=1 Tax=Thermomicrobium sp. 4228-Ro TaxID=2993937 RepID=UPI002248ED1B|nr:amidohydrolase family protein [Thermomicrobium sp. 4228-Ro]MCX2727632.1 amidohydrolase family protein [Thermomicrobium sp. 4228-Ro]